MINSISFWLNCSRWYTLPMTIFSWLVIFVYGFLNGGNIFYGILALLGICSAHLATNLFDDFCDYKNLSKIVDDENNVSLPNTQKGKCSYLLNNSTTEKSVLKIVGLYCFLAIAIGLFFSFAVGKLVLLFMLIGAIIVLSYSVLSNLRLSELAIAVAFGPLLFGGVYYVMTGNLAIESFILSIPTTVFTVNLIYTDTFLDKELDKKEGKKTLVGLFKNDRNALRFQKILLNIGYLSVLLLPIFDITNWQVLFIYVTIPLAFDLQKSLLRYSKNSEKLPIKRWYHFPFEDWDDIVQNRSEAFMFRMYQARNLMCYCALIIIISLLLN
ncbi:prenyltransferase [bacterium]|nr:prenyltransferase [bacterium]